MNISVSYFLVDTQFESYCCWYTDKDNVQRMRNIYIYIILVASSSSSFVFSYRRSSFHTLQLILWMLLLLPLPLLLILESLEKRQQWQQQCVQFQGDVFVWNSLKSFVRNIEMREGKMCGRWDNFQFHVFNKKHQFKTRALYLFRLHRTVVVCYCCYWFTFGCHKIHSHMFISRCKYQETSHKHTKLAEKPYTYTGTHARNCIGEEGRCD